MNNLYSDLIIKPLLSEKNYQLQSKNNTYVFKVKKTANKTVIKQAIENLFQTKVKKINIVNYPQKQKRVGRFIGLKSSYKKAYVKLKPGEFIGENPNQEKETNKLLKKEKK